MSFHTVKKNDNENAIAIFNSPEFFCEVAPEV